MRELGGKVAVVTGAASGIGRAFAERLAQEGMKVVLADIEQPALDTAVQELRRAEHDVIGVEMDVMSRDAVRDLAQKTLDAYGGVHLVFNNAGVHGYIEGPIWEATANDWAWTMGVNFWGVVNGVETFLPLMLASGEEGHIVNTASAVGYIQPQSMYYITKHAVVAYTELLHGELVAQGAPIHVSLLTPGSVSTRFATSVRNRPTALKNPPDPEKDAFGEAYRARMASNQTRSMPASQAAEILLDAVKNEQFYVFTDHEWDERARVRFDGILARTNPPPANRGGPESMLRPPAG
jgi:NAD(P)-dependent dehydrogenase (short-subunit alcohol dehydrogenase family)